MAIRIWGPAPNRHLAELGEALSEMGCYAGARYGGLSLGWNQLGTAPDLLPGDQVISPWGGAVDAALAEPGICHMFVSFANVLCFRAMAECARRRLDYVVMAEAFLDRWNAVRVAVRNGVYRYLLRNALGGFALGQRAARDLARVGIARGRIAPGMYPGPKPRGVASQRPGEAITYCGRLIDAKGVDLLIEAVARLEPSGQHLLRVIGDGPERARLEQLAAKAGIRCEWAGTVSSDEVFALMSRASVVVLPTRECEGWGYVVNEAVVAGVPVVVSSIVAARELVVEGVNGSTFIAGDSESLGHALAMALGQPAATRSTSPALPMIERIQARPNAEYLLAVMQAWANGQGSEVDAPWLKAAEGLGASAEVQYWRDWRDESRPRLLPRG